MTRVEISLTFSLRNTCDIPSRSNSKRNKQYRLTVNWHASIYLLPYAAPIRSSVCQRTEFPKRTMISGRRSFFLPSPSPLRVQGGKTFCASFCASLIAGSRRAFLCVDWPCRLCLFVKCTRCERLLLVEVCKAFLFVFCCCSCWFFVTWKLLWIQNNQC